MSKLPYSHQQTAVLDHVPDGWRVIENANTAPKGFRFVSNNKSRFGGEYRHALVAEDVANEWRRNNPG